MVFKNAAHAVRWADNYLTRPQLRSQFSQITPKKSPKNTKDGEKKSAGTARITNLGPILDLKNLDLALTISVCLSEVSPPQGTIYRHVHGRYPHTLQLANDLAHKVWDGPGRVRTIAKMRVLAALRIEDCRQRGRYGTHIKSSSIARQIGVKRDCYYDNWQRYSDAMIEILDNWLVFADQDITGKLIDKGLL